KFSTASCKCQASSSGPSSRKSWVGIPGSNSQRIWAGFWPAGVFFLRGMAVTQSTLSYPHTPQFVVHCFLIESLWVEFTTYPLQQFFVPAVVRVAYRFHEV